MQEAQSRAPDRAQGNESVEDGGSRTERENPHFLPRSRAMPTGASKHGNG